MIKIKEFFIWSSYGYTYYPKVLLDNGKTYFINPNDSLAYTYCDLYIGDSRSDWNFTLTEQKTIHSIRDTKVRFVNDFVNELQNRACLSQFVPDSNYTINIEKVEFDEFSDLINFFKTIDTIQVSQLVLKLEDEK